MISKAQCAKDDESMTTIQNKNGFTKHN